MPFVQGPIWSGLSPSSIKKNSSVHIVKLPLKRNEIASKTSWTNEKYNFSVQFCVYVCESE